MGEVTIVRLESWHLTDSEQAMPYLQQMLGLSEGDADHLDDLHTVLAQHSGLGIVLIGSELLRQSSWGKRLLGIFMQAANENKNLHLVFQD